MSSFCAKLILCCLYNSICCCTGSIGLTVVIIVGLLSIEFESHEFHVCKSESWKSITFSKYRKTIIIIIISKTNHYTFSTLGTIPILVKVTESPDNLRLRRKQQTAFLNIRITNWNNANIEFFIKFTMLIISKTHSLMI